MTAALQHIQTRNIDDGIVRVLLEDTTEAFRLGPGYRISGVKEGPWSVEIDSDENKIEGEIQALYGKILSGKQSAKIGKFPIAALTAILGSHLVDNSPTGVWQYVTSGKQLPYLYLQFGSKWLPGLEGRARTDVKQYRCKCSSFSFVLGQDNFAEVELEWMSEFTTYKIDGEDEFLVSAGGEMTLDELEDHTVYTPVRVPLQLYAPDTSSGFTGRTEDTDIIQGRAYRGDTEGHFMQWIRTLGAGTNVLTLFAQIGPTAGVLAVTVDGTTINQDLYAGVAADNQKIQLSFNVAASGAKVIRFEIVTANPSSSGDVVELASAEIVHQGSAPVSEVNTLPVPSQTVYEIPAFQYSGSSTTPTVVDPATNAGEKIQQNGLSEWVEYQATLEPGTYSIVATLGKHTDYGILSFTIDGVAVGTVDGYNSGGSVTPQPIAVPGTFAVYQRARVTLRISVSGKNVGSSGYKHLLASVLFKRTAGTGLQVGVTGPTEVICLPWHTDTSTGWSGANGTNLRNWVYTSDGTANRELVWSKVLLLKGTYRARLAAEIEAGGAALELHFNGSKVADLPLAGSANIDGRVEDTFTVDAATLAALSLKNPATTAASVYYLYLEKIS